MKCEQAEEQLSPFLLGVLDPEESSGVDRHIETCPGCASRLAQSGDLMSEFALSVPQLEPPAAVKLQLLSRVEGDLVRDLTAGAIPRLFRRLGRGVALRAGFAIASTLVLALVLGAVWFNGRLSEVAQENQALALQMETAAQSEQNVKEMLRRVASIASEPDVTVKRLSATQSSPKSRGMIYLSARGGTALLTALDLPVLAANEVYQVWLVKDGQGFDTGVFTVDSSGYGHHFIDLTAPLAEFDAVVITVEQAGGSPGPTGRSVLKGDL